jgi:DNA polymerase-3 subunit alpha
MAHAVSYGIVAYNGCWLKKHEPVPFWLGELEVRTGDLDKIREYLRECQKYVLNVDVQQSDPVRWEIEPTEHELRLRPPLMTIKGCGLKSMQNLRSFIDAKSPSDLVISEVAADVDEVVETTETEKDDE